MGKLFDLDEIEPSRAAHLVVDRYCTEAERNLEAWAGEYKEGIREYIHNPEKVQRAIAKLAHWYAKLKVGKDLIKLAFALIKAGVPTEEAAKVLTQAAVAVARTR